jgi:hypothetical protein
LAEKSPPLHPVYYKYIWLLGQFIQHTLLSFQGVRIPDPPELKEFYPDKNPAELINIQRELYGCQFDWETGELIVKYDENLFDISVEASKIIAENVSGNVVDCFSFDDNGFNFYKASRQAVEDIINYIKNGEKKPL